MNPLIAKWERIAPTSVLGASRSMGTATRRSIRTARKAATKSTEFGSWMATRAPSPGAAGGELGGELLRAGEQGGASGDLAAVRVDEGGPVRARVGEIEETLKHPSAVRITCGVAVSFWAESSYRLSVVGYQ